MKIQILSLCTLLLMSCGGNEIKSTKVQSVASGKTLEKTEELSMETKAPDWVDKLIVDYIEHSENELIRIVKTDSSVHLSWIFDRVEKTDTATYLIYRLGHSFEHRYVTEAWLYIDSNTKTLHEYDIANDKLL